jgi:3-hydroxyacyl-CoA dehydrogenase
VNVGRRFLLVAEALHVHGIFKVAVIGAGVMGAGIAVLFANAGVSVVLLDLDPALAEAAMERQRSNGAFVDLKSVGRVQTGSSAVDLALVSDADWIIEAAAERIEIKLQIFAALNAVRKPGSIVSSNTSTIRLAQLLSEMQPTNARDYLITHFFNPPHAMRLLELVAGPLTCTASADRVASFASERLDRCVVRCRDTPGFIANRLGNFWMAVALDEAVARYIDVEQADALLGKAFGTPLGVFGLLDLVGIDLLPVGWSSLQSALAPDDPFLVYSARPQLIVDMIATGRIGRKGGGGFYRKSSNGQREALDLRTNAYRLCRPASLADVETAGGNLNLLADGGEFLSAVVSKTLAYAAFLVPEIADTPDQIDQAMREGYGWKRGPFEMIGFLS